MDRDDTAPRNFRGAVAITCRPRGADVMTGARTVGSALMTQEGYSRLREELQRLTQARAEGAERLRAARGNGGAPAENGELMDAMDEQVELEQRIRVLEARLACAVIASPAADGTARIGTR